MHEQELTKGQLRRLFDLYEKGQLASYGIQYVQVREGDLGFASPTFDRAMKPDTIERAASAMNKAVASVEAEATDGGRLHEKLTAYTWGTGRRKTAVARVRIAPGSGKIQVNGRSLNEYFKNERDRK